MYNKVTKEDVSILQSALSPDRVLTGDAISPDYAHDELGGVSQMPEVLVRPLSTEEVAAVMRLAYEREIPVTVRGSGTGLVGAAVPVKGGILMETTGMNKILSLDRDRMREAKLLFSGLSESEINALYRRVSSGNAN